MIDPRFVLLGAALTLIGFTAQLDDGVGWPSVLTLSIGVGPAIIFTSTFVNRRSYWRITGFDLVCGAASLGALVVWLTVPDPQAAVLAAVLADLLAGIPTIRKAWHHPETEIVTPFALGVVNATITLLTLDRWDPATWAFPVYLIVLMVVLMGCVLGRPGPRLAGAAA